PSAARPGQASYERLEFLGDRVLDLVVAALLLRRFPDEPEGMISRRHSALVRAETLTRVARDIGLGAHIVLPRGEEGAGLRERDSVLADAMEAVIAALWLDGGDAVARDFVERHWGPLIAENATPPKPAKMALQEWAQARGLPIPEYRETDRTGPDHAPHFTVEVAVSDHAPEAGEGTSKRAAEDAAARALLDRLERAESGA
ncbi:MAG: ribonuclease III, partial [Alphaproteobacteria bacterium]